MTNFAIIWTILNIGMDDDWTKKGQEQTHMQLATKKIKKYSKSKKNVVSLLNHQS